MRNFFLSIIAITALLALGFTLVSESAYRSAGDYVDTTIIIEPHTGVTQTLTQLHAAGLTPSVLLTMLPVVLTHEYAALKAGEYHFAPGLSAAEIISQIAHGDIVIHKVTIPEGWNVYQVRAAFMAEPLMTGPLPPIPEGSVMPDTMRFTRGEPRIAVLARLQKEQTENLARLWQTRDANLPVNTPLEALTLASVVEKETGVVNERAMVAGVFTNRLRQGIMLQSDPTVVYGIEAMRGGVPMGRPLSKADLMYDTPYNSYTRVGLPPTPICNPGKAAIDAALHPAATDALYFVATGTGGHHFAATLAEHEQNVAAYHAVMHDEPAPVPIPPKTAKKSKKAHRKHTAAAE
jgi:UPF0755 protein